MTILNEFLTFEHNSEHDSAHNLSHKRDFSAPKIYSAKGDIKKRWYVYFSFRDPETKKLKRQKNIYGNANTYKTKEDRLALLSRYRKRLLKLLQQGYNPYVDNTELFKKLSEEANAIPKASVPKKAYVQPITFPTELLKKETPAPKREFLRKEIPKVEGLPLRKAFDFSLKIKANQISKRSLKDYEYTTIAFIKWAAEHRPDVTSIRQVDKKVALDYLNAVLIRSSARNRNNNRLNLSSLLQTLEENDHIDYNPIKKIPALRSIPTRNKSYTTEEHQKIFKYLKTEDPILLLFIKFISYNLLRPVEVCRLKIKDINIQDKTIQFKAKNSPLKTKLIPNKIIEELPDLSKLDPEGYLFTPIKIGGEWDATDVNKSNYFSKRYKSVVKDHFNLDKDQTLYSFRHTFISILYQSLLKGSSPHAAKSELMNITGHATMDALEKYLRDIDAVMPKDYSKHFDND
ncbi:tyrosine-type recombinase/integrase [Winogradskyella arenosi]|uniref:Integrase n=1 Tax=Winogradskyella arenosi TaxID=533325 RepID=A0A368ZGZ9_9FLAO|nr:tyrosine-type recombinase/integrase [Winogradskyella arenosi]RCW91294.1 integrase [Winogradskyella arenosi]